MNKKNLVKKVIDHLIHEGNDFADLTQSALIEVPELNGVSKTTIKRAKKEYMLEKIVVQRDYKEQTIKRRIYKYLDRYPKSTLYDLREALPNIPPAKVAEYHLYWKKKQERKLKGDVKKPAGVSPRKLKDMIFKYLNENEGVTLDQLLKAFPNANKSSVSSYFGHWRKKQRTAEMGKEGGLFQVVTRYLDKNPDADIDELKQTFSDVPRKSLEVYQNLWFKKREEEKTESDTIKKVVQEIVEHVVAEEPVEVDPRAQRSTESWAETPMVHKKRGRPPKIRTEPTAAVKRPLAGSSDPSSRAAAAVPKVKSYDGRVQKTENLTRNELIDMLKKTIEAQRLTISELDSEHLLLKERMSPVFSELEEMDEQQLKEVRSFIATYLNGLKQNPSGKSW